MLEFLSVFPPYRGGIARFSERLSQELKLSIEINNHNFRKQYPAILFPGQSQFATESAVQTESYFHPYAPWTWKHTGSHVFSPHSTHLLYSHWHPFFIPALLPLLKEAQKKHIKTIGLFHNVVPHEFFPGKGVLTKRLLSLTDQSFFLSEQTYQEAQHLDSASSLTKLFHPVYEHQLPGDRKALRERIKANDDTLVFLFFGLVRAYKGVDVLINAFVKANIPNSKLVIAGEFYESVDTYSKLLPHNDTSEIYLMNKFASYEEMADLFRGADVLVVPYKRASQSGVIADGIWFETPMIVSHLPGLTEHVQHGVHGLHVQADNVDELSQQLQAMRNDSVRKRMATALHHLKNTLSWRNFTQKFIECMI